MRRASGSLTIAHQITLGLIEGVVTMLGFIVVVFPLALWSVPQQGKSANTIFYIVLAVGCGAFIALIGLAYLKSRLFPDRSSQGAPAGGKPRLQAYQAYQAWMESQEDARRVERQIRSTKGSLLHDLGFMVRIAALLGTVFVLVNLAAWALMVFYYGDPEFLSADERWQLLHPDPWNWK